MSNYNTEFQANNTDLQVILNKINNLSVGGYVTGTFSISGQTYSDCNISATVVTGLTFVPDLILIGQKYSNLNSDAPTVGYDFLIQQNIGAYRAGIVTGSGSGSFCYGHTGWSDDTYNELVEVENNGYLRFPTFTFENGTVTMNIGVACYDSSNRHYTSTFTFMACKRK